MGVRRKKLLRQSRLRPLIHHRSPHQRKARAPAR
ncbi:hypothetical protein CJF30_00006762 [Rutstroemia sp. NJR-2017a BBW]|nr:hypothetical protein CJF30_00006762 [Rutstroemia sp. NJR-2017a BBW]